MARQAKQGHARYPTYWDETSLCRELLVEKNLTILESLQRLGDFFLFGNRSKDRRYEAHVEVLGVFFLLSFDWLVRGIAQQLRLLIRSIVFEE